MKALNWKYKLILIAVGLVLLAAGTSKYYARQGVIMGESFYALYEGADGETVYRASSENSVTLRKTDTGADCEIHLPSGTLSAQLVWDGNHARITFGNGEVVEGEWRWMQLTIDGRSLAEAERVTFGDWHVRQDMWTLADGLCRMDRRELDSFGEFLSPRYLWYGLPFCLIGALLLFMPVELNEFSMFFSDKVTAFYEGEERKYRIVGGALMIFGMIMLFVPGVAELLPLHRWRRY